MKNDNNCKESNNNNWTLEELFLSFYTEKILSGSTNFPSTYLINKEDISNFDYPAQSRSDFDTLLKTFKHYSLDSVQNSKLLMAPNENKNSVKSEAIRSPRLQDVGGYNNYNGTSQSTGSKLEGNFEQSKHPLYHEYPTRSLGKDNYITISDNSSDQMCLEEELKDLTMEVSPDVLSEETKSNSKDTNPSVKTNNNNSISKNPRNTTSNGKTISDSVNHEASTSGVSSIKTCKSESKSPLGIENNERLNSHALKIRSFPSTINISTSPDIFTTNSSSPESDVISSVSHSNERCPYIQNSQVVNPYMPYGNDHYMRYGNASIIPYHNGHIIPYSNDLHMSNANNSYLLNANGQYMRNPNGFYMPNANMPFMPNANGSYIPNANVPYIPIVNGPYIPNANDPYKPNVKDFYMMGANFSHTPNANGIHMPSSNGTDVRNTNGIHLPSANGTDVSNVNGTLILNANEIRVPKVNGTRVPNANGTHLPNANGTHLPNANGARVSNAQDTRLRNDNGSRVPKTNGAHVPKTNGTRAPKTNGTHVPKTNGTHVPKTNGSNVPNANEIHASNANLNHISNANMSFRAGSANSLMPHAHGPFMPLRPNCCCHNCIKLAMDSPYNNTFLQFPALMTPYQHHPNLFLTTSAASSSVPAHTINSQTAFTPTIQPTFRQSCTSTLPVHSTPQDDHSRICNICNYSHSSSVHMRINENDNSFPANNPIPGSNTFIRPHLASNWNHAPFRGSDSPWIRPRERCPSAMPRVASGFYRRPPSLRNLPKSSLNNFRFKGKKVSEKYGRVCGNCETTHSRTWKYDEEGRPFCNTCRYFHVHHRGAPPMTLKNIMQGRNRRGSESEGS